MKKLWLISTVLAFVCLVTAQELPRTSGWVVLPVSDYALLRSKAYPVEAEPPPAPIDSTLTRVDYDLHLDGALATGSANLTVDILRDGWARVVVPTGLLVSQATLGGKPVALVRGSERDPQISAWLHGTGRFVLRLDVTFAVSATGGEERLTLPVGGSAVTRAAIALDPREVEVVVSGGFLSEKAPEHWLAYARGTAPLTFAWKRKIEERKAELPLRMRGSLKQLFSLGEDSTSLSAEVEIEVTQGAARQVKIAVPESIIINQVPGATVADWDVQAHELTINFIEPEEHTVQFTIVGETHMAREGPIAIPLLRLVDVERETGGVAVDVLGAGEMTEIAPVGLDAADASELGPAVAARQSPSLTAFRLHPGAQSRSLAMTVMRYTQQAVLTANVEEARYRVLLNGEGKTLVQARYAVRSNQRNFVRVTLPANSVVWSASLAGRVARPGKAEDGSLLFPLPKSGAGEEAPLFAIEILYSLADAAWSAKGHATLALPSLDLPISRTGMVLYYSPLFRVTAGPGAFRAQQYERPASPVFNSNVTAPPAAGPSSIRMENLPVYSRNLSTLVKDYNSERDSRQKAALLSMKVSFPTVGPWLYFVSELTAEGKAAALDLDYQKEKKGGVK